MFDLSVGYVAGIIAAGIFVARIWAPNVITFVVSALLRDEASATTWTVAARALNRSHWPEILQSDAALNRGVRKDILLLTRIMGFLGALIGIAGIVTPLGLYQTLLPDKNVDTLFKYLPDTSPFGYGTPPRSNFPFNRVCGYGSFFSLPVPCPFSNTVSVVTEYPNGTTNYNYPYGIDVRIPEVLLSTFSSGTSKATTVSNSFDIQWRRYRTTSTEMLNNGTDYLHGAFRTIQSLIMNAEVTPVEGLVVDVANGGGIGLRNHTVPPGFKHGVTWDEDLLFIQPETVCVDTNVTIDFVVSSVNDTLVTNAFITDRGGFININHTYPRAEYANPQADPELHRRAYKAAWLQNVYTMLWYNITNPYLESSNTSAFSYMNTAMNKTFPVTLKSGKSSTAAFDSLGLSASYGSHILGSTFSTTSDSTGSNSSSSNAGSNPFQLSSTNFTSIKLICTGAGNADLANSTNALISCGMMMGVPQRMTAGSSLIFDRGSEWSSKIYTCASAVKAQVKTVSFNYNGTNGHDSLKSLAVDKITEKAYKSPDETPLWGIENTQGRYKAGDINLLWGMVSDAHQNNPNVTTFRKPYVYLPGWIDPSGAFASASANDGQENLPGSDFSKGALTYAYCVGSIGSSSSSCSKGETMDYSGSSNMALWARWQNLTKTAEGAASIPNLIWTDIAASMVVGTKGVLGPGNIEQKNIMALPVTPTILKIRYRYFYAIPAILTLLCLILVTLLALVVMCFRGFGLHRMRLHLLQLSPGRIYTTFLFPSQDGMTMRSTEWGRSLGRNRIDLSNNVPVASLQEEKPNSDHVYDATPAGDDRSAEGDVLMSPEHASSQGDIGYGFAHPQPYSNQYKVAPGVNYRPV